MEDVKWLLRRCGLPILLLLIFVIAGVFCWGKLHAEKQKVAEEVWEPPIEIENSEAETEEAENAEISTESAYWFIPQASDDLLSEKEKEQLQSTVLSAAESVREIYKDIVIADAPSYSSGINEFTHEQRKAVVEQLGRSGLVSVEEDTAMQNHEVIETFYADYLDGRDSMVTENDSVGMFDSVEAVGFQDIDGDGAKDVIVIINYVTGAGPQGMMPRKTIRIFSSQDNGFVIQHDLMDELMENMNEDDISIPAICDYVTLMETNEIYDGYRTIYQQYFADEGCDFMISYGANGNSRVILNENEEIIEYLVYDRLSENEKCELYVLYRSKKNTDGSWYILEAEILDIFAYSMSTKDVVSSGKTSWSATGSEEHEIN